MHGDYRKAHDSGHRVTQLIVKNIETLTSLAKDMPSFVTREEITLLLKAMTPLTSEPE